MAKFEYTVKFNGRKYFPGEEVPLESDKAETVAVAEEVAVAVAEKDEPKETKTPAKKNGKKPKA